MIYLIVTLGWIAFSDSIVFSLFSQSPELLTQIQTFKGVAFVFAMSGLIYVLLRRDYRERTRHETDFRYLFMNNPNPMWVVDRHTLYFLEVNNAALNHYGYTRAQFLKMTLADIRPPEEMPRLRLALAERDLLLQNASEWRHRTHDGRLINVEIQVHPLKFDQHDAILTVVRDITIRKQAQRELEESRKRLEGVLNNVQAVIWSSHNRQLTYVNPTIENIYGYPPDAFMQDPSLWTRVIHPDDLPGFRAYIDNLNALNEAETEYRIYRRDGTLRWLRHRVWKTQDAEGVRMDGVITDMTEHMALLHEQREKESLQRMLDKEIELRRLRNRYASMLSHEFRTPLTNITSSAGMLEAYYERLTPEKRAHHFHKIQDQVKELISLLDDMLALSKAEDVSFAFQPTRLNLVALCNEIMQELAQRVNKTYVLDYEALQDQLDVIGDERLLRYILNNLLSNAVKYTPGGGKITVRVFQQEDDIVFSVRDQGIGIPLKDQDKLFVAFHRAHNVGGIPGTGLGLAITKQAIELHDGRIDVESQEGVGTLFTVHLPCA
ncbi:MAG: PAS domain S-box protein [Anaerolineae bacterium]